MAGRGGRSQGPDWFGQVLAAVPRRRHDPGVCLAQLVVALADGAECLSDLDEQAGWPPRLFGPVLSRSTAQRVAFYRTSSAFQGGAPKLLASKRVGGGTSGR